MDGTQAAHVGENVRFDFVLTDTLGAFVSPAGAADYAVVTIDEGRREIEPDSQGHFSLEHRLTQSKEGDRVRVRAEAVRQNGRRDYMQVQGRWLRSESERNEPDRSVAGDSVDLLVYQSAVELHLDGTGDELDLETGVLRLRKLDGTMHTVYADRPGPKGFSLAGPDRSGKITVTFSPDGDMVNPTGTTDAEFSIQDRSGRRIAGVQRIKTP